jgi:hypothetical protein
MEDGVGGFCIGEAYTDMTGNEHEHGRYGGVRL